LLKRKLTFEAAGYSLDAIQRAAYRLSDKLSVDLETSGARHLCTIHVESDDDAEVDRLVAEFRNQALDETLRERIRTETTGVRNVILSLAFADTALVRQD
jgi:His-Xaa-Ser system protein HxsD